MPATILTSAHYNAVRALIAPDITDTHISDDYLSQLPFAPEAEKEVRKRLSSEKINVDTLTGNSLDDALLAMMHECAAVLCLTAAQLLQQTELQVVTRVQNINWKDKRVFHLTESDSKINDVIVSVGDNEDASTQRKRTNPFGAVGTERKSTDDRPSYPYSRRIPPHQ